MKEKKINALFDTSTIRIYQAYNHRIAEEAMKLGTFGSSFKMDRMTWIKPSFLWMMYRSGWATKSNQERILAIDITREGFNNILLNSFPSSFNAKIFTTFDAWKRSLHTTSVIYQWDPDRDIFGTPLDRRAIQLGLKGTTVEEYVTNWIVKINDITDYVLNLRQKIQTNTFEISMLPFEQEYPLDEHLKKILGIY